MKKHDKGAATTSAEEAKFLSSYDMTKYPRPSVAADIVAGLGDIMK